MHETDETRRHRCVRDHRNALRQGHRGGTMTEREHTEPQRRSGSTGRRGLLLGVGALVVALAATLTGPLGATSPAQAAEPTTNYGNRAGSNVLPNVARTQAQCDLGITAAKSNDASLANQIMAGKVAIEKYGTVIIPQNPTWRPQSGLDSSGDAHMTSLHYLMPLLREGVRTGNQDMINRFYVLIRDWSLNNRLGMKNPPNSAAWQPIYTGFRMQVIGCALAGPRGNELWLRQLAAVHANYVTTYRSSLASNNTGIQLAMGQYVLGCSMSNAGWRDAAIWRLSGLANSLIFADGSTNEGAVSYAKSDYQWFNEAARRIRLCGQSVPSALGRVDDVPEFMAHAIRPDGRYEALGDTSPDRASTSLFAGTLAEWSASRGTSGSHPDSTFAYFRGGFIFGRSGWGTETRPYTDQTFYSVRTGKGRSAGIFHAHADAGSVTFYANGSPQLYDTGQWKYQYGSTRDYVMGRNAHNVVTASGGGYTTSRAPALSRGNSNASRDLVTLTDTGYRKNGITLTRTIMYSRGGEYLVVWDNARSSKKDADGQRIARTFTQHWQLGPGRPTTVERGRVSTDGTGGNTTLIWVGAQPALSVANGWTSPRLGWVSQKYGELSPAPMARATRTGTGANWVTVIIPRRPGVPSSAVTATGRVVDNTYVDLSVTNDQGRTEHVTLSRTGATVTS
jgi:hypothetical protein